MGINKSTLEIIEKQTGDYFIMLLVTNKEDNFSWNMVVLFGDAQNDGKAKFLIELVHI